MYALHQLELHVVSLQFLLQIHFRPSDRRIDAPDSRCRGGGAGLGDIAVPGLLACLSLRYDAARSSDVAARAEAAGRALQTSLRSMVRGLPSPAIPKL